MLIKAYGSAVQGIRLFIVGLTDNALKESQERIETAISNNDFEWPRYKVVINLAPADLRKGFWQLPTR